MAEKRTRRTRSEIITDKIAKLTADKEKYENKAKEISSQIEQLREELNAQRVDEVMAVISEQKLSIDQAIVKLRSWLSLGYAVLCPASRTAVPWSGNMFFRNETAYSLPLLSHLKNSYISAVEQSLSAIVTIQASLDEGTWNNVSGHMCVRIMLCSFWSSPKSRAAFSAAISGWW